jgi:hypothetical protein
MTAIWQRRGHFASFAALQRTSLQWFFRAAGSMKKLTAAVMLLALVDGSGFAAPAVPAKKPNTIAVANPGFEDAGAAADSVPGWTLSQHAGVRAYEMTLDQAAPYAGKASFRMKRTAPQIYGSITQEIAVGKYAGKTLELSAMARTEGVGPEGWVLVADLPGERKTAAMTGTAGWRALRVRIEVPVGVQKLSIGAMLLDAGTGWLDDVKLRVVEP